MDILINAEKRSDEKNRNRSCWIRRTRYLATTFDTDPRANLVAATNDAAHGANGLEVLRMRKHLFLEKPMAQTIRECDDMIEAWKNSKVVFMVGLELR